jgi:hypothetical protein
MGNPPPALHATFAPQSICEQRNRLVLAGPRLTLAGDLIASTGDAEKRRFLIVRSRQIRQGQLADPRTRWPDSAIFAVQWPAPFWRE